MAAQKISFSLDLRWVTIVLSVAIVGMFALWKPWVGTSNRSITESGQASITATPDTYTFSPQYTKRGSDKAAIQSELNTKTTEVIAALKNLGVKESSITVSSQAYDNFYTENDQQVTYVALAIEVDNKTLAQKVQDYLTSTAPDGSLAPYPSFSTEKRKTLEAQAKIKALKDARQRAERTANELDVKLGKVLKVQDQTTGSIEPYYSGATGTKSSVAIDSQVSLPVLGGEQEISYTVEVTYEIK